MNMKRISIIVFIIGTITLLLGVTYLLVKSLSSQKIADGEYLVEIGTWRLSESSDECDSPSGESCESTGDVVWNFTAIGKGKLTTNNHLNDYDFIWAIEDNKLKIETDWFYPLENEYQYSLDQNAGKLELTDGEKNYYFIGLK